jgi:hypothetical protein
MKIMKPNYNNNNNNKAFNLKLHLANKKNEQEEEDQSIGKIQGGTDYHYIAVFVDGKCVAYLEFRFREGRAHCQQAVEV